MADLLYVGDIKVPIGTHEGKTIVIGADHRGYDYKNDIIDELSRRFYHIVDVGTYSPERCDYPEISDRIGRGG